MSLPGLPRLNYRVKATSNALEFWWQAPLNDGGKAITGYNLWCSSIPYSTIIGSSTFYAKASSLTNSQEYVFQLAAINTVGTGAFTNYEIAQPGIISQSGVTNLTVASNNSSTATVSWTFSNGVNEATNKFFAITMYPSSPNATISTFRVAAYANQRSALISGLSTTYYTFMVQTINDAGWSFPNVSTLTLITPPPPITRISGLTLWLDGNDPLGTGAAVSNGTVITTWFDKSPNGYNAAAYNSPTLTTNSLNSLSGVSITAGNSSKSSIPAGTFISAINAFIVYKSTGANNTSNTIISRGNTVTNPNLGNPLDTQTNLYLCGLGNAAQFTSNYNCFNTSASIFNINMNQASLASSNLTLFSNGTAVTGIANRFGGALPTWTPSDIGNLFVIGGRADNGANINANYHEVVVFNTTLGTSDRQLVEGYLAWKWGLQASLPGGHPYRSAAPT